jgi:hypothetical protein
MKWFIRALTLVVCFGVSLLATGCGEDNEKTAGITGKAPEGGATSYQDAMAKMKGGTGGMQQGGYPGAKRQEAKKQ